MSNSRLWREVRENAYGLFKLPLPKMRRDTALRILDQRVLTMKGSRCVKEEHIHTWA